MAKIEFDKKHIESIFNHYKNEDSILVTTDGNTFLNTSVGKSYCRDHCKRAQAKFAVLTRQAFESGATSVELPVDKSRTGETPTSTESKPESQKSWQELKWDDMIAFAQEQGFTPETKMNQGKETLIAEITEFLAAKESGANPITNHK